MLARDTKREGYKEHEAETAGLYGMGRGQELEKFRGRRAEKSLRSCGRGSLEANLHFGNLIGTMSLS